MGDPVVITITEPVTIRGYRSGGMGGYGGSSTPLHRLVERRASRDVTACRTISFTGLKTSIVHGSPKPAAIAKYGVCRTCWPT